MNQSQRRSERLNEFLDAVGIFILAALVLLVLFGALGKFARAEVPDSFPLEIDGGREVDVPSYVTIPDTGPRRGQSHESGGQPLEWWEIPRVPASEQNWFVPVNPGESNRMITPAP